MFDAHVREPCVTPARYRTDEEQLTLLLLWNHSQLPPVVGLHCIEHCSTSKEAPSHGPNIRKTWSPNASAAKIEDGKRPAN
jgi:hypothetical protein